MKAWKVLGLAGLAGVAATGVVIARDERRRREVSPDEVRDTLRARYAAAAGGAQDGPDGSVRPAPSLVPPEEEASSGARLRRLRTAVRARFSRD